MATVIAVTVDLESERLDDVAQDTIEVPSDIGWSDFELMLRLAYDLEAVVIKYIDEDNDQVTISSDEELREAFRVARMQMHTLNVKVSPVRGSTVVSPPRTDPPRTDPPRTDPPRTEPPRPEPIPRPRPQIPNPVHNTPPLPGIARPVTMPSPNRDDVTGASGHMSSSSSSSSDESVTMEVAESSKDTASSPDSPHVRCFFVRHVPSGLVLDVQAWGRSAGTHVILWAQKRGRGQHWTNWSCENQLFVEDEETGTIRSYFCGLCLEATESRISLQPFSADRVSQRWTVVGSKLQNGPDNPNWVIGLADDTAQSGAYPKAMTYQGNNNQHWAVEYVTEGTLFTVPPRSRGEVPGGNSHTLFTELAEEMARQMSVTTSESESTEGAPVWFTSYMEKFKHDICEEISTLVTRKTVRQVLAALHSGAAVGGATGGTLPPPYAEHSEQRLVRHPGIICDSCDMPITGIRYKCGLEEKILRKQEKTRRRGEKQEEKLKRREEKLKRRLEVRLDTPSKKEKLEMPRPKGFERINAEFIADENFADGSRVVPNRRITKRWVMRNTGLQAWNSHTKLSLMWGNIPAVKSEVDVPHIKPNEECTVSVDLITPCEPGVYQSHWRMSHRNVRFGHRVWCSILVVKPREDTPPPPESEDDQTCYATKVPEIKTGEERQTEEAGATANTVTEEVEATVKSEKEQEQEADEQMVEDILAAGVAPGEASAPKEKSLSDVDILSAQDILSFEMLDIRDRNTPKVSQTATPTNTPMAMTPPKSPIHELEEGGLRHLSTSSSVEIVSESSEESTSHMTELVQERIAKLGLKPDHLDDLETISTCSEDSNDSDSDFYIVPLPDCFNPNLPMSVSTSSVLVTREEVQRTVDDILTASKNLDAPSLVPDSLPLTREDRGSHEPEESMEHVEMAKEDTLDDVSLLAFEMPPAEAATESTAPETTEAANAASREPEPVVEEPRQLPVENALVQNENAANHEENANESPADILTDENANSVPTTPEGSVQTSAVGEAVAAPQLPEEGAVGGVLDLSKEGSTKENPICIDDEDCPTDSMETQAGGFAGRTDGEKKAADRPTAPIAIQQQKGSAPSSPHTPPSPTVLASSLMTAALGVATQAAATAYTTAKDVFHTLQANNQYVPPKSNWKPPQQKWSPPKQEFTMPKQTWTPPEPTWTPPEETAPLPPSLVAPSAPTPAAPLTPMDKLIEMGFGNRELNEQLLKKHSNDVQKVVQELVSSEDNNWHQTRH